MPPTSMRSARWLRAQRQVLTLGPVKTTLWLTLGVALAALLVSQALWWSSGGGASWRAALVAVGCALLMTPLVAWPLLRLMSDLEVSRMQLDILATRDELTGVANRRQFLVQADREWARCRRYDMDAALLMIDVDLFKSVNDTHGHLAGDLMLREIARAITETLRQPDLLGRFGGEEFTVFLPHADPLGALDAAERIRERVARLVLEWRGQVIRSTVSVGAVALTPMHDSLGALIADADQALYAAKAAGRNCVRTAPGRPAAGLAQGTQNLPSGTKH